MGERNKKIIILKVAEKLFANNGYEGTSIRDIAREGSFNTALISYYFGSKEKLLASIFVYRLERQDQLFTAYWDKKDPLERLSSINAFYVDEFFEKRSFFVLMNQVQAFPGKYVTVKEICNELQSKINQVFSEAVEAGQQQGILREEINVPLMVAVIFGSISKIVFFRCLIFNNPDTSIKYEADIKDAVNTTLRAVVAGLILP
ncbi:TetR/AcrR family transcriptional regulator [Pedobacter frigidisoli]|nr:TetR family transcriptional regulator [Pedobacter frigidisoli]